MFRRTLRVDRLPESRAEADRRCRERIANEGVIPRCTGPDCASPTHRGDGLLRATIGRLHRARAALAAARDLRLRASCRLATRGYCVRRGETDARASGSMLSRSARRGAPPWPVPSPPLPQATRDIRLRVALARVTHLSRASPRPRARMRHSPQPSPRLTRLRYCALRPLRRWRDLSHFGASPNSPTSHKTKPPIARMAISPAIKNRRITQVD